MAAEKQFENRVKKFLKERGCWVLKYWAGGGFTRSGVPDLLVCCDGFFIAVELKASRGKPSELQLRELHRIRDSGGIAVLLYPRDMNVFMQMILAIQNDHMSEVDEIEQFFAERMKEYE